MSGRSRSATYCETPVALFTASTRLTGALRRRGHAVVVRAVAACGPLRLPGGVVGLEGARIPLAKLHNHSKAVRPGDAPGSQVPLTAMGGSRRLAPVPAQFHRIAGHR